jgi:hypothetical protein
MPSVKQNSSKRAAVGASDRNRPFGAGIPLLAMIAEPTDSPLNSPESVPPYEQSTLDEGKNVQATVAFPSHDARDSSVRR